MTSPSSPTSSQVDLATSRSRGAAGTDPGDVQGIELRGPLAAGYETILTPDALEFVASLQRTFDTRRRALLEARQARQARIEAGELPTLRSDTAEVREAAWQVAETPDDLQDRRVEITGPPDRKMMINALNSGASVFMADLEDSCSPTWDNVVTGQINLRDAVRRTLRFEDPARGKVYALDDEIATLLLRPRGWHLDEANLLVDGRPCSASLFDFGLYFFHNARESLARGSGPYFYLAKLESHLEARLWNDVFDQAQDALGLPRGTIRATVLIETILAAFEIEEILYELRTHSAGCNAGRWDYIFSAIKRFRHDPARVLPDRADITMTVPFMRAYTERLVKTCHKRGAHAIGGMSAFIPSRRDPEINEVALRKVRDDKVREANDGFDGTWVAHPDLVAVAREVFDEKLGAAPHQKQARAGEAQEDAAALIDFDIEGGSITRAGAATNVEIAIEYIAWWLTGLGAVAINNLMEDAATAEISRAQLWQWLRHEARLSDTGERFDEDTYRALRDEAVETLSASRDASLPIAAAADLLDDLVLDTDTFVEFLTLPAYDRLDARD